jgi:NTP pyrophosphatase (non-canonical NTP hydrolase)
MTGNEYQQLAMRTNDGLNTIRLALTMNINCDIIIAQLLNGVLGLTGEAGEVSDLIKKGIFHEKGIDLEHLKKELGDCAWYLAMICDACGFTLDDVMQTNIDKLKARYPEGFDTYRANNRAEGDI